MFVYLIVLLSGCQGEIKVWEIKKKITLNIVHQFSY